jgi:hypothetical protein
MAIWWACRPETPDQSDLIIDLSFLHFKFLYFLKAKDVPKIYIDKKEKNKKEIWR